MVNFLSPEPIDTFKDEEIITPDDWEQAQTEIDLVKRDPFDPAPIIKTLGQYNGEIDKMVDKAMVLIVTDDTTLELATTYTTQAKALSSTIKKTKDEKKRPYLTVCQALDQFTKQVIDRLDNLQTGINGKIRPYLLKKEQERIAAEFKAREEADRIQRELDEKAAAERQKAADEAKAAALAEGMSDDEAAKEAQSAAAMVEDAPVVVAQTIPDETAVKTETGTAKLKEEWTFEITDIRGMPNEAFEARKAEVIKALTPWIRAQINAGLRNISGVKIFKQAKVATRASKNNFKF